MLTAAEENLLAIGADVRRETGSDVFSTDPQLNEWMQRVKKLGSDANEAGNDDDERARKFEEVRNTRCSTLMAGDTRAETRETAETCRYSPFYLYIFRDPFMCPY